VETEDVVHVLRNVHGSLRARGLALDIHPLGHDFPVRAGPHGLGFVDASRFALVVAAMDAELERTIVEGLFQDVRSVRRHVAERFDDAAEALEHASGWENLRLPAAVRRRLRAASERPVEFVEAVRYRLLEKAPGDSEPDGPE
jgi:hypothetical protein